MDSKKMYIEFEYLSLSRSCCLLRFVPEFLLYTHSASVSKQLMVLRAWASNDIMLSQHQHSCVLSRYISRWIGKYLRKKHKPKKKWWWYSSVRAFWDAADWVSLTLLATFANVGWMMMCVVSFNRTIVTAAFGREWWALASAARERERNESWTKPIKVNARNAIIVAFLEWIKIYGSIIFGRNFKKKSFSLTFCTWLTVSSRILQLISMLNFSRRGYSGDGYCGKLK